MNLTELAQRIKRLRTERGLTLDEVASRTGLTRGWLSKVENFRITPSLPAVFGIAEALGVTISELLDGLDRKPVMVVVRCDERQRIDRDPEHHSRIIYESLAHKRADRWMDPFLLTVPPGGSRDRALTHEGEEFLMVLDGPVGFEFGGETLTLNTGDCVYFDASTPHRLVNATEEPARMLAVFCSGQPSAVLTETIPTRVKRSTRPRRVLDRAG